jgi:acylphosphatase
MKRIAFVVTGRVQRVGYRRFDQRAGEQAGVSGHVRN